MVYCSNCCKIFKFRNFSNFQIGIETRLKNLHFNSWTPKFKNDHFYGLNSYSPKKKCKFSKYTFWWSINLPFSYLGSQKISHKEEIYNIFLWNWVPKKHLPTVYFISSYGLPWNPSKDTKHPFKSLRIKITLF